jgi:hypothetical protein
LIPNSGITSDSACKQNFRSARNRCSIGDLIWKRIASPPYSGSRRIGAFNPWSSAVLLDASSLVPSQSAILPQAMPPVLPLHMTTLPVGLEWEATPLLGPIAGSWCCWPSRQEPGMIFVHYGGKTETWATHDIRSPWRALNNQRFLDRFDAPCMPRPSEFNKDNATLFLARQHSSRLIFSSPRARSIVEWQQVIPLGLESTTYLAESWRSLTP